MRSEIWRPAARTPWVAVLQRGIRCKAALRGSALNFRMAGGQVFDLFQNLHPVVKPVSRHAKSKHGYLNSSVTNNARQSPNGSPSFGAACRLGRPLDRFAKMPKHEHADCR